MHCVLPEKGQEEGGGDMPHKKRESRAGSSWKCVLHHFTRTKEQVVENFMDCLPSFQLSFAWQLSADFLLIICSMSF